MTALLTRLASMRTDLGIWLDRLSNWQFVAALGGTLVLGFVIAGCVLFLIDGNLNVRTSVTTGVLLAVVTTSGTAWRRWR
jgi:hypothetical protein